MYAEHDPELVKNAETAMRRERLRENPDALSLKKYEVSRLKITRGKLAEREACRSFLVGVADC